MASSATTQPPPPTSEAPTVGVDGDPLLRVGLCQMAVGADKKTNLNAAARAIESAVKRGAKMVVLPECFNSPYGVDYFAEYAEEIPAAMDNLDPMAHPTTAMLRTQAKQHGITLVGGSFPERHADALYNTCLTFSPQGELLAKFRKMHLFDVDVPGGIRFQESATLSPGNALATFDAAPAKVGLGICYDIRFPEVTAAYRAANCHMMVFPSAFNMTTGPMHWKLLARARAVDAQAWVCLVSPARDENAAYTAWGHSMLVSPWGHVVAEAGKDEAVLVGDVDVGAARAMRAQIPTHAQKRHDLFTPAAYKGE